MTPVINVGIADMKMSDDPAAVLTTYPLGSCIGVIIHDPVALVGGILHFMLPESALDPEKAKRNPFIFGDTGIPLLFCQAYNRGAVKERLVVKLVGGARMLNDHGAFDMGGRNQAAVKKLLLQENVVVAGEALGGSINRTVRFNVGSGGILIKEAGKERRL